MAFDIAKRRTQNAPRWRAMQISPSRLAEVTAAAKKLVAPSAKARYKAISQRLGGRVPWPVIAVIHDRECGGSWNGNLAQGDPWNRKSVNDPANRGPFDSFEDAAIDALTTCAPHAANWTDWSNVGALLLLLQYNGDGYGDKPSPYLWGATNQYVRGKFIRDHDYDPNYVDLQIGCAALLKIMAQLDPDAALHDGVKAGHAGGAIAGGVIAATGAATSGMPSYGVIGIGLVVAIAAVVGLSLWSKRG